VVVSQYFQWKHRMKVTKKVLLHYPEHGEDLTVFDFAMREHSGLPNIIAFLNQWADEIDHVKELLLVRYEDLRSDPEESFRRIVRFVGGPEHGDAVRGALAYASVDNMRAMEQSASWLSGGRLRPGDRSNPDSFKVRRAKVGGYRDYFDEAERSRIDAFVRERLSPRYGYDLPGDPREEKGVPA
jgi:hypothetical protein